MCPVIPPFSSFFNKIQKLHESAVRTSARPDWTSCCLRALGLLRGIPWASARQSLGEAQVSVQFAVGGVHPGSCEEEWVDPWA